MLRKQFLLIPLIIGISAGVFLVFSPQTENNQQFTSSSLIQGGSPIMGESNAQITILEWGDYQCTFCYKFHQNTLDVINDQYIKNGKVKLIYKDFPLNGPDSFLAAEATYCAEDQGKYWQYHNELYKNWGGERTGWVTRDSLDRFATTINLNLDMFDACLDDQKYQKRVRALYEFGKEIGIDATPSFLVFNDEKIIKIIGNQPLQVFLKTFDEF
ncbi:MAG TPA: thioredoxin domain-containing protein [Nitrosopumilus sp.]|jgi:protein-disulfide isomerase|nr:disulfide bond formation protein DsbA [Nitrososphaerota archaeon]MDP6327791.1 thioredoxin domain-containing protein [Nitrosopumilus sp.]HJM25181.1 thioredoxin domain-containing protein [Nitrosopumilus sp.]HJO31901.1 thioredoxin domain-containing protein [Nitrosopumilus sp.]|tara:strand:+ start:952 stop:1593 length:642 start_codon:yes stop_codon:yes gene_type:complete